MGPYSELTRHVGLRDGSESGICRRSHIIGERQTRCVHEKFHQHRFRPTTEGSACTRWPHAGPTRATGGLAQGDNPPTSTPSSLAKIEAALGRNGVIVFCDPTPGARLASHRWLPLRAYFPTSYARARVMGSYIWNRNACRHTWSLFNDDHCSLSENWTRML